MRAARRANARGDYPAGMSFSRFALLFATISLAACGSSTSDVTADDGGAVDSGGDAAPDAVSDANDATSDAAAVPRLSIDGTQILGPDGAPILLRGWNWGEWGSEETKDAADNAMQGANVVRIPLRWWGDYPNDADARKDGAPGNIDPAHLTLLDKYVGDAIDKHLWVVLFVDSNCGQASLVRDTVAACGAAPDGSPRNFMNDPDSKKRFIEAWSFLAQHYASWPYIGMYELLPEPNFGCKAATCADWTVFPKFYAEVLPAVRAGDPRTPVLVGAGRGYDIQQIETSFMPGTEGIVYTGDLLQHAASDPTSVGYATAFRDKHHVPVFIQQVGIPKSATNATMLVNQVLGQLRDAQLGWTWWTYREPRSPGGNGFAPLYGDPATTDGAWLALIDGYFK